MHNPHQPPPGSGAVPQGLSLGAAAKLDEWLESRPLWQRLLFLICCMLPAVACAYWKPLTNDELFTFEIARLGSLREVWRALVSGADNHPPLDYLLRHLSMSWFGQGELAFRLPSLIAVTAALVAVYQFVVRRACVVYGLIALLIPLSTPLYEYAYEGRAYALLAAFAALSLAAWQRRTEGSHFAPVLLAASLAAMLWSHYYGVLVFVPIVLGELVRSAERRRLDWAVWGALAVGATSLLPLVPFMRAARQIGAVFWTKVGLVQALYIYPALVDRLAIVFVVIAAVVLFAGPLRRGETKRTVPRHELAAVVGFLLLPLLAYVLARAFTGALAPRYVLGTVIGIAIAFALAGWEALGKTVPAQVAIVALAVSALGGDVALMAKQRHLRAELKDDSMQEILSHFSGPVVMSDNDLLMQLWHYEPPEIARRLFYVSDEQGALDLFGWNTTERAFDGLKPWTKMVNVQHYPEFMQAQKRFMLIETTPGYVSRKLLRQGATIVAKAPYRDEWVFEVELPGGVAPLSHAVSAVRPLAQIP